MRESSWQIEWDALGETPVRLLGYGDLMPGEIERSALQAIDEGRFDFARSAAVAGRSNARRSMEFGVLRDWGSDLAAWQACHDAVDGDPWALTGYLSVRPEGGVARFYLAALRSSSHSPNAEGPGPRSEHRYEFATAPVSAVILPGGLIIVGGYYNEAEEYVIPAGGLPPEVGIDPGDILETSGPGGPEGNQVVVGGGLPPGGSGPVAVVPEDEVTPPVSLNYAPSISGVPNVGELLTAVPGSWNDAAAVAGEWFFRGVPTGYHDLSWAIPGNAVPGDAVIYRETASNVMGSATADSNVIIVAELAFENTSAPSISGTAVAGNTLNRTEGAWQSADSVSGEWYLNGAATGEAGSSYGIDVAAEVGDEIFYRETASKTGEADLSADSNTLTVAAAVAEYLLTESATSDEAEMVRAVGSFTHYSDGPLTDVWRGPNPFGAGGAEIFLADTSAYDGNYAWKLMFDNGGGFLFDGYYLAGGAGPSGTYGSLGQGGVIGSEAVITELP